MDCESLLRIESRMNFANISYEQKHPVLLPSYNHVVSLMIKYEHELLGHARAALSNLLFSYWPLNGLRQAKKSFETVPLISLSSSTPVTTHGIFIM